MKFKTLVIFFLFVTAAQIHADDEEEETTSEAPAEESENESTEAPSESSSEEPKETENPKSEEPKTEKSKKPTCNLWPSDLKHPRDCCDIPHNPGSITLNTCFYRCSAREIDEQRQVDCAAGCFVNTTGILIDNRLNRERLKNMFVSGMFPNDRWLRVMEDAIDSCEFNSKGNLHKALASFYACIHDYLADHCVNFIQTMECEKTQELYEDCHQVRLNCDYWPRNLASPEFCCKIPPLFSLNLTATCRHICNTKELFVQRQQKCIENCLFNDTKLRSDGKFNFNVVMEMLIESSERSKEWRKPIEMAVEKCKKALGDRASQNQFFSVTYEITSLQTCLREYFSTDCPEFRSEPFCRKVQHFVKHCPNTSPRKTHYFHNNSNGRVEPNQRYD